MCHAAGRGGAPLVYGIRAIMIFAEDPEKSARWWGNVLDAEAHLGVNDKNGAVYACPNVAGIESGFHSLDEGRRRAAPGLRLSGRRAGHVHCLRAPAHNAASRRVSEKFGYEPDSVRGVSRRGTRPRCRDVPAARTPGWRPRDRAGPQPACRWWRP
ncbi:hypothetical protein GCM10010277_83390 [Streptomyces longisporoflavus]|nr:hypothetical protein GCM10010277_83390 [Streptomyces longisporoflavus]